MIEINALVFMAMSELLVILLVVVVGMVIVAMKRRKNDQKAAEMLIDRVKKNRTARREKIRCLLNGKYQYQDEQLDQAVRDFSKIESGFYKKLIDLYLARAYKTVAKLDQEVEAITEPYFSLALPVVDVNGVSEEESECEATRLRTANERLKEELAVSMNTLGRMLSEYSDCLCEEPTLPTKGAAGGLSPLLMNELIGNAQTESGEAASSTTDESIEVSRDELLEIPDDLDEMEVETAAESSAPDEPAQPAIDLDQTPLEDISDEMMTALELGSDEQHEAPDDLGEVMVETADEPSVATDSSAPDEPPQPAIDLDQTPLEDISDEILDAVQQTSDLEPQESKPDQLSDDEIDELEQVATQIEDMVVDASEVEQVSKPEPKPEMEFDVDDIDALLAAAVEASEEVEESPDPDDILDQIQKGQNPGQEIDDPVVGADEPAIQTLTPDKKNPKK